MIRNRFAGNCATCGERVGENKGWVRKEDNTYKCYCDAHAPEAKPEVKAIARRLTADGKCITGYEPDNLDLFRALPGAQFVPQKEGGPHWAFSLAPADRRRVLEIGRRLNLEIDPELLSLEATQESQVAPPAGALRP